jgi:hypothetical protein
LLLFSRGVQLLLLARALMLQPTFPLCGADDNECIRGLELRLSTTSCRY